MKDTVTLESIQDLNHVPLHSQRRFLPDTHWAKMCWLPAPPETTGAPESLKRSTQPCPVARRSPARMHAEPQGCVHPGYTGSSWTGRSACHSRWASEAVAELSGPRHAGMSLLSCRSLEEEEHDMVRVNYRKLLLVSTHTVKKANVRSNLEAYNEFRSFKDRQNYDSRWTQWAFPSSINQKLEALQVKCTEYAYLLKKSVCIFQIKCTSKK